MHCTRSSALFLALLIAADGIFIVLFIIQGFGLIENEALQITRDRSYGEIFQYIKQCWIAILSAGLAVVFRCRFCATVSVLFTFFLIDDFAEIHEKMGSAIAYYFEIPNLFGVEAFNVGELIVLSLYAAVALALVWVAFPSRENASRLFAKHVVILLAAGAFFGVGIDAVHALPWPELIGDAIAVIEDGGEMVVISLLAWRVFDELARRLR